MQQLQEMLSSPDASGITQAGPGSLQNRHDAIQKDLTAFKQGPDALQKFDEEVQQSMVTLEQGQKWLYHDRKAMQAQQKQATKKLLETKKAMLQAEIEALVIQQAALQHQLLQVDEGSENGTDRDVQQDE